MKGISALMPCARSEEETKNLLSQEWAAHECTRQGEGGGQVSSSNVGRVWGENQSEQRQMDVKCV